MSDKGVVGYILFKKVVITQANAISSPLTYGFPAITGFLGAFHAISRKIQMIPEFKDWNLGGVLLACHDCQVQGYRPTKYSNYTFNQSRNPLKKDGKTASIIEEGKCRLVMSFVVEVMGEELLSKQQEEQLVLTLQYLIQQIRIAGGSVQKLANDNPVTFINHEDVYTASIAPLLQPAFILMNAEKEFKDLIEQSETQDPVDVLLDIATLHHIPETKKNGETKWTTTSIKQKMKTGHGWLVPMPIGYQGISEVYEQGVMKNVRNPEYPSQYVEAIYGLGKWISPQRSEIENAFWHYQYNEQQSLYLVTQDSNLN